MKTFYMKTTMKFLKLLPALIFFMLALSYNARSQTVTPNPVCYGDTIFLNCSFLTGGCGNNTSTYHWENFSGSWQSSLPNPKIAVGEIGYASDKFYLSIQYAPPQGGFSGGRVTVIVLAEILVSGTTTPITCFGQNNGTITLNVSGGSPLYTYLWSDGVTTKNRTGLAANTYSVTVTDSKGCKNINPVAATFTITGPTSALDVIGTGANLNCFGVCEGSIDITASGGTAPYTYLWSNGATTGDISGICADTYSVTVTDFNNCQKTGSWTITTPSQLIVTGAATNALCFNSENGSVDISINGGTMPYTYLWSNGATTEDISLLPAGAYGVTVTDLNNCQTAESFVVGQPDMLVAIGAGVDASCYGGANGSIDLTVSGGTTPYIYMWSNGVTTEDISGLAAGAYSVTVTDVNNCEFTDSYTIGQPSEIVIFGTPTDANCNTSCDGQIFTYVLGGVAPYTYLWSNGGSTANIDGLCAGSYSVSITDANGCIKSSGFDILAPPALSVGGVVTDALCNASADGSINITPAGGTSPYTFEWSNGPVTEDISGLVAGTYIVTITDANNCTLVDSWDVYEPGEVSWTGETTNITCNGFADGTITTLTTLGGTAPYTYYWEGPSGFTATTANLANLAPGTYNLTVTDSHSCDARGFRTLTEPDALTVGITASIVMPLCNGGCDGSISGIMVSGGTAPYSYLWDNGVTTADVTGLCAGLHYVTVTDFNNCVAVGEFTVLQPSPLAVIGTPVDTKCDLSLDGEISTIASGGTAPYFYAWSNGATTADITGLAEGTYSVTVSDAHSCGVTGTWTIGSPDPLSATAVITDALCNKSADGAIDMTPVGGTTPYLYEWSNGASTQDISGLLADTYAVTITDVNLCTLIQSFVVNEPGEVSWTGETTNITCNGDNNGTITTLTTLGGTAPYTYYWEGPSGFTATTANLANLAPGTYNLTVTDSHSCDARGFRTLTEPDVLLIVSAVPTSPTCYTGCDGSISGVIVTGGTAPYSYLWSNGTTTANVAGLCAGFYTLTVTDDHGCIATQTFEVVDAPEWSFEILGPAQVCCSTSTTNTTAVYTASDLTGTWSLPVTWQWTVEGGVILSGQNTNSITVLWSCCGTGKVYLTVNQGPVPCSLTKELPVVITSTPAPIIAGPVSVIANDNAQYCVVNGDPTHLYTWNVVGGVVVAGQGTSCITVAWGDYPPCGCGEVTVCESTQLTPGVPGCTGCATMAITILPNTAGINLSGTVTYKNAFGTALNGVTIKLRNVATNSIVATTVTGPNMNPPLYTGDPGYYAFMNVAAGSYKLEASFNGAWGGNNATDALLIQIEAGTPGYLLANYGLLNLGAADVNGSAVPPSSGVTALDALYVKLRTVGSISSYPAGDWKFDNPTIIIPAAGPVNFNGLCLGDVNGSYIPTGLKELSYLSSVEDITQTVPVEETFTYAIRANSSAKLGAMTLFMGYDADLFEVVDIASQNDEMKYVIENGTVAIAWADTKPMSVANNDQLFTLTVKAKAPISEASSLFSVKAGSEFADALGNRFDNFELKMSKVITPNGSNEFTLFNYPNPFTDNTKIVYSIPESGSVKLVVTDMFGKTVRTLVDEVQTAGNYSVNVNAAALNLSSGVYLYRIEVAGTSENFVKVNKLIFTR